MRMFELWFAVLNSNAKQLVDPKDPVYPYSYPFLGGLSSSSVPDALHYDENRIETLNRLSYIIHKEAIDVKTGRNLNITTPSYVISKQLNRTKSLSKLGSWEPCPPRHESPNLKIPPQKEPYRYFAILDTPLLCCNNSRLDLKVETPLPFWKTDVGQISEK
jgi:hypothetical protein